MSQPSRSDEDILRKPDRGDVTKALLCLYTRIKGKERGVNKVEVLSAHQGLLELLGVKGRADEDIKRPGCFENWFRANENSTLQHSKEWRLNEDGGVIRPMGEAVYLDLLNKALVELKKKVGRWPAPS